MVGVLLVAQDKCSSLTYLAGAEVAVRTQMVGDPSIGLVPERELPASTSRDAVRHASGQQHEFHVVIGQAAMQKRWSAPERMFPVARS